MRMPVNVPNVRGAADAFSVNVFMRKSVIILAILWLCGCPLAAQPKTEAEQAGFKGRVKTVRAETAKLTNASDRSVEGRRVTSSVVRFNERGATLEQTLFNPDGSLRSKLGWARTYDIKGEMSEILYLNADGQTTARGVPAYDRKGRENKLTLYNPDGSVNHTQTYVYDDRGNKIQEFHRDPDGTARIKIIYSYDAQGRLMKVSFYKPDGTLDNGSAYEYDAQGREVKWVTYRGDESATAKVVRGYDIKSNSVETTFYREGIAVDREKEVFTDEEFDVQGNWVKRSIVREIVNGGKARLEHEVVYRKITYF
jgi:hypothetical protein